MNCRSVGDAIPGAHLTGLLLREVRVDFGVTIDDFTANEKRRG